MSRRSNLYPSAAGSSSSSSYTQKPYTPGGGQRTNGAYGNSNGSSSSQPPPLNGSNDHPTATNSAGSDYVPASNFNKTTYSKLTTTTTTIYSPTANTVDDYIQDETLYFEKSRIQQLRDERIHIQKKTFKKWCNSYLNKARMEINDLFTDFADGTVLIKFLEIISGEKFCKPNRGRMRVQKIENINKSLEFLKSKGIQVLFSFIITKLYFAFYNVVYRVVVLA
jgi:hypothetical protein